MPKTLHEFLLLRKEINPLVGKGFKLCRSGFKSSRHFLDNIQKSALVQVSPQLFFKRLIHSQVAFDVLSRRYRIVEYLKLEETHILIILSVLDSLCHDKQYIKIVRCIDIMLGEIHVYQRPERGEEKNYSYLLVFFRSFRKAFW